MEIISYMRADTKQIIDGAPDITPLIGRWKNCNAETDHIARLLLSSVDGALRVQVFGANLPDPTDWGEVAATPYASSGRLIAEGFHTKYDFGSVETWLAANQKQGILVIQSYTSFKDGSGRPNIFAREFFHHG
ncbi:MAG TPA: hypothetical protein VG778_07970 [Blastocatellia bacterium]|nr:hypothetical protein [Blastocatellia bacterium]